MEDYFTYTAKLFDQRALKEKPEVFKGLRVLDFTHVIYGPTASKILVPWPEVSNWNFPIMEI
jgi:hypothetical protein